MINMIVQNGGITSPAVFLAPSGVIQARALENSNVDIAEQLVNLITAQHNFQANSQVISTADTVTQTLLNLR